MGCRKSQRQLYWSAGQLRGGGGGDDDECGGGEEELVAVKVLKAAADAQAKEDLLNEAAIMASFQHRHILSLRGIVINGEPVCLSLCVCVCVCVAPLTTASYPARIAAIKRRHQSPIKRP